MALLMAFALVFCLAACGEEEVENTTEPTNEAADPTDEAVEETTDVEETDPDSESGELNTNTVEAGVITVGETDDEALADHETVNEFVVDENGELKLMFTTGETVTNFTFFVLDSSEATDGGDSSESEPPAYAVGETLYTLDEFTADGPVVITLTWPEDSPYYGFSYTDADGVTHSFTISANADAEEDATLPPVVVEEF